MNAGAASGAASTADLFAHRGYLLLPDELPPLVCRVATRYALMQEKVAFSPEAPDEQVPGSHSVYGDALMESLLDLLQPRIEQLTQLQLFPTYAYYRVYRPGDELRRHRDREACEISATLCLGQRYVHGDPGYRWALQVAAPEDPVGGIRLDMDPGGMALYRGCDLDHWREKFTAKPGSYLVQAFLHYVDQNGPCREYRYDKRMGLGFPAANG